VSSDWSAYLDAFHARYAGRTEEVLRRCVAGDLTPYRWVLRSVAGRGRRVLDLACGSGPLTRELASERTPDGGRAHPLVVGIDRSMAELRVARRRGDVQALCADATALPFADHSFDAVVCSMGLMVVQPLDRALAECARVLRSGGMLAATVASPAPLRLSDLVVLAPLTARLRTPPRFPGGAELTGLAAALDRAGFDLIEDARERFAFRVRGEEDAELLLSALYLPDVTEERRRSAVRWLAERAARAGAGRAHGSRSHRGEERRERAVGVEVAVPVRRVLAMRR
jgi:SAM-dependent methyltransferase